MAEILTGSIALNGLSSGQFNAKRLSGVKTALTVASSMSGKSVLIISAVSSPQASSVVTASNSKRLRNARGGIVGASSVQSDGWKLKTTSASLTGTSELEIYHSDRDIAQDMADYLPRYYNDFQQVVDLLKTESNEFTRMRALLRQMLDQFYVNSATFGLDRYEHITDIDYIEARSADSRRHYINSKLRGTGTVTKAMLEDVINSFYSMKVNEINDEYITELEFVIKRGEPKNLEDIEAVVNDIIPAHLGIRFKFKYTPWGEFQTAHFTWADLSGKYPWRDLRKAWPSQPVKQWEAVYSITWDEAAALDWNGSASYDWSKYGQAVSNGANYAGVDDVTFAVLETQTWAEIDSQIEGNRPEVE